MNQHFQIGTVGDLVDVAARRELERQAEFILSGAPKVREQAVDYGIFSLGRLRKPKELDEPLEYRQPLISARRCREAGKIISRACIECGRPMDYLSAARCRFCYRVAARLRYYEIREVRTGVVEREQKTTRGMWEDRGDDSVRVQIVMPETEWWDETDEGLVRFARVSWRRQLSVSE